MRASFLTIRPSGANIYIPQKVGQYLAIQKVN
jgi:hypothetical protein